MKTLIVIGIILILAAITNPKKDEHIDKIKRKITSEPLGKALDGIGGGDLEVAGNALGITLGMKALDAILEGVIGVDNYVIFSLTRVSFKGNERVIGFGAFGNIWLVGELDKGIIKMTDDEEDIDDILGGDSEEARFLRGLDSASVR